MTQLQAGAAAAATPDQPRPVGASSQRVVSLDFIRGLAVMGILAANIVAFGQPFAAYMYPGAFITPHGEAEGWMWVAQFVLIDGKMRGLFSLLFGAGLYLFMERARARGATRWLQARRLLWLGLFGLVHFFFIWRGDILFLYAAAGLVALLLIDISRRDQFVVGLLAYFAGAVLFLGIMAPMQLIADSPTAASSEPLAEMVASLSQAKADDLADGATETELKRSGDYFGLVEHRVREHTADLGVMLMMFWLETLPLMLLGMALYRKGMFDGSLDRRKQMLWGWAGVLVGGALSLIIALWARSTGFTYYATLAAFSAWSPIPRLMMTLGLAALLALWGLRAGGWLGRRVSAAGRAAFTNYLGTSVVMMLVFHGWAGGLFGELTRGQLYAVVALTWILMLVWSKPWLERYRYGPLEWLWRCLTYGKRLPLRK